MEELKRGASMGRRPSVWSVDDPHAPRRWQALLPDASNIEGRASAACTSCRSDGHDQSRSTPPRRYAIGVRRHGAVPGSLRSVDVQKIHRDGARTCTSASVTDAGGDRAPAPRGALPPACGRGSWRPTVGVSVPLHRLPSISTWSSTEPMRGSWRSDLPVLRVLRMSAPTIRRMPARSCWVPSSRSRKPLAGWTGIPARLLRSTTLPERFRSLRADPGEGRPAPHARSR